MSRKMDYSRVLDVNTPRGLARDLIREALSAPTGAYGAGTVHPIGNVLAALRLTRRGRLALREALAAYLIGWARANPEFAYMLVQGGEDDHTPAKLCSKARDEINAALGIKAEAAKRKQDRRAALFKKEAAAGLAAAGGEALTQGLSKKEEVA